MSPRKCDSSEPDCAAMRRMLARIEDKWSTYIAATLQEGAMRSNENRRTKSPCCNSSGTGTEPLASSRRGCSNRTCSLPASSQRLIKLDHAHQLGVADLREGQFGSEEISVGVQGV